MNILIDVMEHAKEKLEKLADPDVFNADGFHLGIKGDFLCIEKEIGKMLYEMVIKIKPQMILEFGTAQGYSTCWFMLGLIENGKGEIITVDHYDRKPKIWDEIGISKNILIDKICESDDILKELKEKFKKFDMVFLDTHHRIENITSDIEKIIPFINKGSIILIHDTNYVPQMGIELQKYFEDRKDFDYTEMKKSCGLGTAIYKGEINDISVN